VNLRLLLLQCVGQIRGRAETNPLAVMNDAGYADGDRQVRFARTRSADQNQVVRASVNVMLASCMTSWQSTGEPSKPKSAITRGFAFCCVEERPG
jgi:hypothetical protein